MNKASTQASKAADFWQFSLTRYAQSGVSTALLYLQDHWGINVNVLLLNQWITEQGKQFTPNDWQALQLALQRTEPALQKHRHHRKKQKSHLSASEYQTRLQQELRLEQQQQKALVDAIYQTVLITTNDIPSTNQRRQSILEPFPMQIPWQSLDSETLTNLIEYFVLREGTDYGEHERSLSEKVDQVRQQLKSGEAVLVYSELHETIDIKRRGDLKIADQPETSHADY